MAKSQTIFVCTECGEQQAKWQGKCPGCDAWNTLTESVLETTSHKGRFAALAPTGNLQKLADVHIAAEQRMNTGLGEFDRVLGGGLVVGAVVLIGGDPGIGKSTLLLQALCRMAQRHSALYVSGEESAQQIALRAQHLAVNTTTLQILTEINLEKIMTVLQQHQPQVAVIDSIQTIYTEVLQSAPGSVAQVRECSAQLTRIAKLLGITIILVGHVTKEGTLAGPRVLEHIVDTVLYFEGDNQSSFRMIRAFKNRFGTVNELGVFAMTDKGLREVNNPSALFLSHHTQQVAGSCITVTQEGTRPILVEIQALVDDTQAMNPKRLCVGLEQNRLAMLLAVLNRHSGVSCAGQDVFINAVGGMRISEPAADLPILLSIFSSLNNKALKDKLIVFGEIGLAGEIRPVQRGHERLKEAAKLGFTQAIVPKANLSRGLSLKQAALESMQIFGVEHLTQALEYIRSEACA